MTKRTVFGILFNVYRICIFQFWDEHVFTEKNILGEAIHGDPDYDLTFEYFFEQCYKDRSLYQALKLADKWNLLQILAINAVSEKNTCISYYR